MIMDKLAYEEPAFRIHRSSRLLCKAKKKGIKRLVEIKVLFVDWCISDFHKKVYGSPYE